MEKIVLSFLPHNCKTYLIKKKSLSFLPRNCVTYFKENSLFIIEDRIVKNEFIIFMFFNVDKKYYYHL